MKISVNTVGTLKNVISPFIHSTFMEYFGTVIYDGLWVGKDSNIPNEAGIRLDVIEGCKQAGIAAVRWPGGCCADHYHWKDGISDQRHDRLHPIPTTTDIWRHDFGTDEFMKFCELISAEPILIANTATGDAAEFLDWFEYCNGPSSTKYGSLRAKNGHEQPYNVKYWGMGNTDENVWWVDYNDPVAYAKRYMQFLTSIRGYVEDIKVIGLGLSQRHKLPGWVEGYLDHVTRDQRAKGPDYLSIHHYIGSAKGLYKDCGGDVDFNEQEYYASINALANYQSDIDVHREIIKEHTSSAYKTMICFDEWGLWHREAISATGTRQAQTLRDGVFAACALHLFYKNCDIVEFTMQTQLSNLLQSLFETDHEKFYKTPTFYVFKLFADHKGQYKIELDITDIEDKIDCIASMSPDKDILTLTIINTDYTRRIPINLGLEDDWQLQKADILTAPDIHMFNSFDDPFVIEDRPFKVTINEGFLLPQHSILRLVFVK